VLRGKNEEIAALQSQLAGLTRQLDEKEGQVKGLQSQVRKVTDQLGVEQANSVARKEAREKYKGALDSAKSQLSKSLELVKKLEDEKAAAAKKCLDAELQAKSAKQREREAVSRKKRAEKDVGRLKKQLRERQEGRRHDEDGSGSSSGGESRRNRRGGVKQSHRGAKGKRKRSPSPSPTASRSDEGRTSSANSSARESHSEPSAILDPKRGRQ
jgi:chromosome segregation ATPase